MLDFNKNKNFKSEAAKAVFDFAVIALVICIFAGFYNLSNDNTVIGGFALFGGIFQFVLFASLSEIISLLYDIKMK
jgi:hypothetical protein